MSENFLDIKKLLGPDGPLAQWPEFTSRETQTRMAEAVSQAFQDRSLAVIEAGTGTGKTLAYLLPAILSRKLTIISTGLLNLQEQIYKKDLPFIRQYFGGQFKVAILKGRSNYLCLKKLANLKKKVNLFTKTQALETFRSLEDWAGASATGDRTEIEHKIKEHIPWENLSSSQDDCTGQNCQHLKKCFSAAARRIAQQSDLVLVNHHLFMADLSLKEEGIGQILPAWEAAVFDEAHLLEAVATAHFGFSLSNTVLFNLGRELVTAAGLSSLISEYEDDIKNFISTCERLDIYFKDLKGETELYTPDKPGWNLEFQTFLSELRFKCDCLTQIVEEADLQQNQSDELTGLTKKLDRAAKAMKFLADYGDSNFVYQAERQKKQVTISALPLRVGPYLSEQLTRTDKTIIMTSATLSTNGSFKYFQKGLGIDEKTSCYLMPSSYNYPGRTLLYLPAHLPAPNEDLKGFAAAIIDEIEKIVNLSRGRTLVLFTSNYLMNNTFEALRRRLTWPLLVQNQMSRAKLLDEFKHDINSVLMATSSFWQGVDVPGESLSTVIIDKLPFPQPERPLVKGRTKMITESGGNFFKEYFLPEATLTLKQGLGRLMRKENDQGLLAILDHRLLTKFYGKDILKSLPPSPRTSSIDEVARFFENKMVNP
ncbi:MAG: ATP-dependent DNA helicase [Deltaproteobacteria bacterium]|jgi:ATP-dependent DNA helicase DinG|nr:ATP-dependent DNA helicase [Deltaproteobacteria bacterium]